MPSSDRKKSKELAHSLNEELTIILNTVALATKTLSREHPANEALKQLKSAAMRCLDVARQLAAQ